MANEDMKGVLFKNDRKNTDRHPDMTGRIQVEGKTYYVSGWWNDPKGGAADKYLSLALSKPNNDRKPAHREPARQEPAQLPDDFDDDTPF